jgi:dTDP-4-amino-4,6-dideoxygalactose transaminase
MIKLLDLDLLHQTIASELESAFHHVCGKGRFILGEEIRQFETAFSTLHGCQYGIGVSSGTDALLLALKAMGIGPGDEVIVPAMTFIATAEAIAWIGAKPVLADVSSETLLLTPELAAGVITEKTRAIIPVHLHGYPVQLGGFLELAKRYNLHILEDCAQAHGAQEQGYPVGSRTIGGCFSFFPGKNLGALGDGGMVVTNDEAFAQQVRSLSNHGRKEKYVSEQLGCNARLDELQAAFLNVKLVYLEKWNQHRRELARGYHEALLDLPLQTPPLGGVKEVSVFHIYAIRCESQEIRSQLAQHLKQQGIETGIHYPVPLHLQPSLQNLGYQAGDFPVSEAAANCLLSLPLYPGMTSLQQEVVVGQIKAFFQC